MVNELKRIARAGGYSWQGLKAAFANEPAFRTETFLFIVLVPLAWWLAETTTGFLLMFFSLVLVLVLELVNSAVEAVVDRIGTEKHELSGRAKDIGSGAVFVALVNVVVVWAVVLLSHL